jgi:hypothetical protein
LVETGQPRANTEGCSGRLCAGFRRGRDGIHSHARHRKCTSGRIGGLGRRTRTLAESPLLKERPPSWGLLPTGKDSRNKHRTLEGRPVAIIKLPGIVACTGAVVVVSESSNPEAILTLKLT